MGSEIEDLYNVKIKLTERYENEFGKTQRVTKQLESIT